MNAARMYGINDIRFEQSDIPVINDNELLVKVKCVGICGTDLRMIRNGVPGVDDSSPRILGHEFSGVIAQVGIHVKHYKEGMRVGIAPNMGCGICKFCQQGDYHLCENYKALGVHMDGGMAEYVRIPENAVKFGNVMEIPDQLTFEEAAIIEPLSCVYNGFTKCPVSPGDDVLIIGAGPIGIMQALFAKLSGASRVMVANRSTGRLEICKRIDDSFITITSDRLADEVMALTGGKGVDVCIVANSSPESQEIALELVGMNGKVNFFGGLPKQITHVPLNSNHIHYKQLLVTGATKGNNYHFASTMKFISTGLLNVKQLISARYTIQDIHHAVENASNSKGIKTVIAFE